MLFSYKLARLIKKHGFVQGDVEPVVAAPRPGAH